MNSQISKIYRQTNDIFGLPQEYKGIKFYPIKIKEVDLKEKLYLLFFHPKNYIPQREIIRMSYLKFLLFVVQEAWRVENPDIDVADDLIEFLYRITKIEKTIDNKGNKNISIERKLCPENEDVFDQIMLRLNIDGVEFSEQEFDNIREILLEQNGSSIEWVESYQPSLEKKLEFVNRSFSDTDFKDEFYSFCVLTGLLEEQAKERTLYQFKARLEREMLVKDYTIFKPKEITGQIKSKSGEELYKHYLSHIEKHGRYSSILVDKDKFIEDSGIGKVSIDGKISE